MRRRGFWMVLVIAGLLAAADSIGWIMGREAGSPQPHTIAGGFHLGMGFVFMAMLLVVVSLFMSKLFFWRHGPGRAHAGRWFTGWEEWHEKYHREREEKGEQGDSPEPPRA